MDPHILAEKTAIIERHLTRVADRLPPDPEDLTSASDHSDAVILHLWQAVQMVIDMASSWCVRSGLGTPNSYADAFIRLARARFIPEDLSQRLVNACGFRNRIAHAHLHVYGSLDMTLLHAIASTGPDDLRQFLACRTETLSAGAE